MSVSWYNDPGKMEYVRSVWKTGLSTKKMEAVCSAELHEEITKNAIIGQASRHEWGKRQSPIIYGAPKREACPPPGGYPLPRLPSLAEPPAAPDPEPEHEPDEPKVCAFRNVRAPGEPIYRRDGSGCLAVKGSGKTVRLCDSPLYSLTKPYCLDCARNVYAKPPRNEVINAEDDC